LIERASTGLLAPVRRLLADTWTVVILATSTLVLVLGLFAPMLDANSRKSHSTDFAGLYASGLQFLRGDNVYARLPFDVLGPIDVREKVPDRDMHQNLNPPFAILLLAQISRLPYAKAYWVWAGISIACAAVTAWLLAGVYGSGAKQIRWSLGLLVVLLAYAPSWIAILLGQTAMPIVLLLAAGWRLARTGCERGAGATLGATLALKPFVGVLLILFLALRRRRLLAWYVGGFAAANLIAMAFMGIGVFVAYLGALRGVTWHGMEMNASIFGLLARLFGAKAGPVSSITGFWPQFIGYVVLVLTLVLIVPFARRLPPLPSTQGIDIGYALCVVLMLLLSPLGWIYYFPTLLICILVIWRESVAAEDRRILRVLAIVAWIVSGGVYFLVAGGIGSDHGRPSFAPHINTAVLVLLVALLVRLGIRTGRPSRP